MAVRGGRVVLIVAAVLLAGLIGWLIHGGGSRVTRVVAQRPATVYEHTPQGAVAAFQTAIAQQGSQPPPRPAKGTNPGRRQINSGWNLLYHVKSYTPSSAVIQTWRVLVAAGYGVPGLSTWQLVDTAVRWQGGRWAARLATQVVVGDAIPPGDGATVAQDHAFADLFGQFKRFPNAP